MNHLLFKVPIVRCRILKSDLTTADTKKKSRGEGLYITDVQYILLD